MTTQIPIPAGKKQSTATIPVDGVELQGDLIIPAGARSIVLFAHGSGSSRHSPRNRFVAGVIREAGIGTLLFDLLTADEEAREAVTGELRFDIELLARRLIGATQWLDARAHTVGMRVGYFGASTGAAAALVAAARLDGRIGAVVSRGGRPDLAGDALPLVDAPTLLIVGGQDCAVICLNDDALALLHCEKQLRIVPRATHLFEEPGTLEEVARLSTNWFTKHLTED